MKTLLEFRVEPYTMTKKNVIRYKGMVMSKLDKEGFYISNNNRDIIHIEEGKITGIWNLKQ